MPVIDIPFVGGAYTSRSLPLAAQECINLFPEVSPEGKSPMALLGTPGLLPVVQCGDGPIRGLHIMGDTLYVVSNHTLYAVDQQNNVSEVGTVEGHRPVSMADNGQQLVIVVGETGTGMVYTETNGCQPITSPAWNPADTVAYLDGYFIFNHSHTGQFFISELYAGDQFSATEFASAESLPDDLVAVFADHRYLWLFGQRSVEIWQDTGNAQFPFERIMGGIIERGCAAAFSITKLNDALFWLGDDRAVYMAMGQQPARISTQAIEFALSQYARVDDAIAYGYTQEGHPFYVLTFPTAQATWVFDAISQFWHQRQSFRLTRHRGNCYAYFNACHLLGDSRSGALFQLSTACTSENGDPIRRVRTSQALHNLGQRLFLASLTLDLESGHVATELGREPQVLLQWSDDGARTWSSEQPRPLGKIGEYRRRVIWRRLGSFYQRVFRLVITDPIQVTVIGAHAELS